MFRGLYTAVSGMQTNQKMLDIASNNIANVNTTGFKKDVMISEAFPEVLIKKINGELPTNPAKVNGTVQVERDNEGFKLATDMGFFMVDSPMGRSHSRELKFAVDENGYLRTYGRDIEGQINTTEGNFVLDGQGTRIQVENNDIEINDRGQLLAGGAVVADMIHRPQPGVIGTINSGRRFERTHTNYTQGALEETGNNLNFAIDGRGFFRVSTPDGEEMYTRSGSFFLSEGGRVVTSEGYPLLGKNGEVTIAGGDFQLGTNGDIVVDGEVINQLDMVDILNINDIEKHGNSYFRVKEGAQLQAGQFGGEILQGFLEGSNINPITEMVDIINIMRAYESSSKIVKAYDDMLQRAVNDIGKL